MAGADAAGGAGGASDLRLFALGDSRIFGEAMAQRLGVNLAPHEERDFEDGEHKTRPLESVRGRDVFVLQSLPGGAGASANDRLLRLLFFLATLRGAGAARVTAVAPYLSFSRKDRQTQARDPVTTRILAQLVEATGVDCVVTMEVHNPAAFQNAFRCETVLLDARHVLARHFAAVVGDAPVAVVSPDLGGAKRAEAFRTTLETVLRRPVGKGVMDKQRSGGVVSGDLFAGDVDGRTVIVPDDLIATGTTMARVARACRERGARSVHVAATHGLFTDGAPVLIEEAAVASIVVTDTVSPPRLAAGRAGGRLTTLSVADLFAEAVLRLHRGGSIVELLERGA
jgi:ribose-phosphate pyrophosphokinase